MGTVTRKKRKPCPTNQNFGLVSFHLHPLHLSASNLSVDFNLFGANFQKSEVWSNLSSRTGRFPYAILPRAMIVKTIVKMATVSTMPSAPK